MSFIVKIILLKMQVPKDANFFYTLFLKWYYDENCTFPI